MLWRALMVLLVFLPGALWADDRLVRLHAPAELIETGVLRHMLPRFSLKTQVRVELVDVAAADLVLGDTGQPVFAGLGRTWKVENRSPEHPGTKRLYAWLFSDVGQRTVASFAPDGTAPFGPPGEAEEVAVEVALDGDAEWGHKVSREKCTRCHAVDEATRGWGIGSTPSFGVLRSLPDWEQRFAAFFVLNPHPAFTQITDLTDPFPINRPSPIVPIELNLDELEALLAYVAAMEAADLGRPLDHQ
ncbi:MAG: hypothetical protein AAFX00_13795 [Pseudomonadota bacterium]